MWHSAWKRSRGLRLDRPLGAAARILCLAKATVVAALQGPDVTLVHWIHHGSTEVFTQLIQLWINYGLTVHFGLADD